MQPGTVALALLIVAFGCHPSSRGRSRLGARRVRSATTLVKIARVRRAPGARAA
jgi:hypothetical protein